MPSTCSILILYNHLLKKMEQVLYLKHLNLIELMKDCDGKAFVT